MVTKQNQIRGFLEDTFFLHRGGDSSELSDSDSLMKSGIIDSTGILELVHYLEDTFKIVIADEDMRPEFLDSIDAICSFVERKQSGN